jgi:hypothetical protein
MWRLRDTGLRNNRDNRGGFPSYPESRRGWQNEMELLPAANARNAAHR